MKLKFSAAALALLALTFCLSSCSKSEMTSEEAATAMISLVPDNADFVITGNPEVFLNSAGIVWEDNHFSISDENPLKSRIEKKIDRLDEIGAFLDLTNTVVYGNYTSFDDVNALAYVTDADAFKKFIKQEESLKDEDGYFGFVKDNYALVVDKKNIAHLLYASSFSAAVRSVEKQVKAVEDKKNQIADWKSELLKSGSAGMAALVNLKNIPVDIFALAGQPEARKYFNSDVEYISATGKLDGATASVSLKTLDAEGKNVNFTASEFSSYTSPATALKRLPAGLQMVGATGMIDNVASMPISDQIPAQFQELIRNLQQSGKALAFGMNFDFSNPHEPLVSLYAAMECKEGTAQNAYQALAQTLNDFGAPVKPGESDGKPALIMPQMENLSATALYVDGNFVMVAPLNTTVIPGGGEYGINSLGGYAFNIESLPGMTEFKGVKGVLNISLTGAEATVTLPGQDKFILGCLKMVRN